MGFLLDFVQERLNARANLQQPRRVISFREPQKTRPVALFGAAPGFGEDYVTFQIPHPQPFGPQALEHKENYHGFVAGKGEPPVPVQEAYEDPVISRTFKRSSESTDQEPIHSFSGEMSDKPVTLSLEKKKDFQSVRGNSGLTEADKHEKDLKTWPFDFTF